MVIAEMVEGVRRTAEREMDANIVELVFGWPSECRLVGDGNSEETAYRLEPPNGAWRVRSENEHYWERWSPDGADRVVNHLVPHFTTDISDALTILPELRKRGFVGSLRYCPEPGFHDWEAAFYPAEEPDVNYLGSADSPAMAIVNALWESLASLPESV